MQELSMNVLDVAENSVAAGATLTEISLFFAKPMLTITIKDNGKGMSKEMAESVIDPFCTTRTTRKVGLGLPFLKMAAEQTGGEMTLVSELSVGTTVTATFNQSNIDCMPLGEMSNTIATLIQCNPEIDFLYTVSDETETISIDTRELREVLDGVSFATPEVAIWLKEFIEENTNPIIQRSKV